MSKVIRVSDSCYEQLKHFAEPFVDSPSDVVERLLSFYDRHQNEKEEAEADYEVEELEPNSEAQSQESLIGKRIVSFTAFGTEYQPSNAYEILVIVAGELYKRHSDDFQNIMKLKGRTRRYVSQSENELDQAKPIPNSPYYVMTKFDKDETVRTARKLMRQFDYDPTSLTIEAR